MQSLERCSFCGERRDQSELAEGGGEHAGGLPVVRLCRDCAEACLDALQTERRIGEARSSMPPAPNLERGDDEVGPIVSWTPFAMDGRSLEWSAERALSITRTPTRVLSVRSRKGDRVATVLLEGDTVANTARAIDAAVWLEREGSSDPNTAMGPLGDWERFELGAGHELEWRAERVEAIRAAMVVSVKVRDPATGRSVAMQLDGKTRPGIDDAVMAAAASADALGSSEPPDDESRPSRRVERER